MSLRTILNSCVGVALLLASDLARGQDAAELAAPAAAADQSQKPARPSEPKAGAPSTNKAAEAPRRTKLLASSEWHMSVDELNAWIDAQPMYSAGQKQALKKQFQERTAQMSADQLEFTLNDTNAKLKYLNSPEAQEAAEWISKLMTLASDKKRAQLVKSLPNPVAMTIYQLRESIRNIVARRNAIERAQTAFDQARSQQVDAAIEANRLAAQQAYVRDQTQAPSDYYSPYRTPVPSAQEMYDTSPGLGYYLTPLGGVGLYFTPGRL